jgi:hypothetical protein
MVKTIQYNGEEFTLVDFSQVFQDFNPNWESVCSENPVYQETYSKGTTTLIKFYNGSMVEVGLLVI